MSAIQQAIELWEKMGCQPPFEEALIDHLHNGCVVARPWGFAMAKAIELKDGRVAWFIPVAVGSIRELLTCLPRPLPFIAFCRRGKDKLKVYPMQSFIRRANVNP